MKQKDFLIVGTGGHARVIIDTMELCGLKAAGMLDLHYKNIEEKIFNYPVLGDYSSIDGYDKDKYNLILAIGDNTVRSEIFNNLLEKGYHFPSLVHPTAIIIRKTWIGCGVFINAGVIINAGVNISNNVIINTGAIIEHEVNIGEHSHIGPGVKISGRTKIGKKVFLGIGAVVIDKRILADNVIVGAGSVIIKDIESNSVYAGVPGRKIK